MKNIHQASAAFLSPARYFLLEIFSLFLFFLLKYGVNSIGIHEFDPFYTGNLIVIIPVIVLSLGHFYIQFKLAKHVNLAKRIALLRFAVMLASFILLLFSQLFSGAGVHLTDSSKYIYISGNSIYLMLVWISAFSVINRLLGFKKRSALFYEAAIVLLSILIFSFIRVNQKPVIYSGGNINIAVVLGAAVYSDNEPSPIFSKRIDRASELFKSKKAAMIHVTGGNAPGEISEAKAAFNKLVEAGVPKNKILIENETSTTAEQIRFIKEELEDKFERTAVISDDFHLARIGEMAGFYKLDTKLISSKNNIGLKSFFYYKLREAASLLVFWIFAL